MESVGFTTSDGKKHLGYRISAANIGEPWEYGPSYYGFYYFDETDDKYAPPVSDIIDVSPVSAVDFYYWDTEQNDYQPLHLSGKDGTEGSLFSSEYREKLSADSKPAEMERLRTIRRWILLNATCSMPVYIDKDLVIHSEGHIILNDDIKEIPEYIRINSN